jgi:hypothetical protein
MLGPILRGNTISLEPLRTDDPPSTSTKAAPGMTSSYVSFCVMNASHSSDEGRHVPCCHCRRHRKSRSAE